MNKIWILCSIVLSSIEGFESLKPVVYFSDISIPVLKVGEDMQVSYEYTAPMEYSEIFTTFTFSINNQEIMTFKRYPGFGFVSEFVIPGDKINKGTSIIKLEADCYAYTTFSTIEIESQKNEEINIKGALEDNKVLAIPSSIVKVEKYGEISYLSEQYEFLFEKEIISNTLYKFDLSSLKFLYSLNDLDFNYEKIELIIYGTMDDFPRLIFNDDLGGYVFNLKIEKDDFYQIKIDEDFYMDKETLMISRASGDYFSHTKELYISKALRKEKDSFPFRINIYGAGVHENTLVFDGIYKFSSEPLGLSLDNSVYLYEDVVDEKIMEDFQEW